MHHGAQANKTKRPYFHIHIHIRIYILTLAYIPEFLTQRSSGSSSKIAIKSGEVFLQDKHFYGYFIS